jgi:hypothetical protein
LSKPGSPFCFDALELTVEELEFYHKRLTDRNVIELLIDEYKNVPPWELLPLPHFSEAEMAVIEERVLAARQEEIKTKKLASINLVRHGHNIQEGVNIILRDKQKESVMQDVNKARKLLTSAKTMTGQCAVMECKESNDIVDCEECEPPKPFCGKYHRIHSEHSGQFMKDKFKGFF